MNLLPFVFHLEQWKFIPNIQLLVTTQPKPYKFLRAFLRQNTVYQFRPAFCLERK